MSSRPRILVPTRRFQRKDRPVQFVHEDHLVALMAAGGEPFLVAAIDGMAGAHLEQLLDMADGLLLVEGGDIAPERSGIAADVHDLIHEVDTAKDALELPLAAEALARGLPVLGTCRGAQVLNVVAGGTLYGDIARETASSVAHVDLANYNGNRHGLVVVAGSRLAEIYAAAEFAVNSYHHQGVRELAPRFEPMAHAPDGVIEAFADPSLDFAVGVQYHPERQLPDHAGHWRLYAEFVEAARRRRAARATHGAPAASRAATH